MSIVLDIHGVPTTQGSKRAFVNPNTGRAVMREQTGDKLANWRADVRSAALQYMIDRQEEAGHAWRPIEGAVVVSATFRFERPASHFGSGRNAQLLKPSAPAFPIGRNSGDTEKLLRAVFDAITSAGLWVDDCIVAGLEEVWKTYTGPGQKPGLLLVIKPAAAVAGPVSVRPVEDASVQEALL